MVAIFCKEDLQPAYRQAWFVEQVRLLFLIPSSTVVLNTRKQYRVINLKRLHLLV